jgi:transposase
MKILKQAVGIDVSQKELAVSVGRLKEDLINEIHGYRTFANTSNGFIELMGWVKRLTVPEVPIRFVMEATGVYHESLAYYLVDHEQLVSIVMPNKMSNFQKTSPIKTITDKTASQVITSFGLEKSLDNWKRPKKVYSELRHLTRERDQLIEQKTALKNQLHAEQAQAYPGKKTVQRIESHIQFVEQQEKEIMQEIKGSISQDQQVKEQVKLMESVPGIGILTATIILSETNGFDLIRNKKQLTSYAGLDVKEKESGTSVKGKPKISKKGNRYLRKAMHFPALTAIRHDERFKAIFARLVQKHGIKMKAAVAVQRKLLELVYTIYKTNKPYDKEYLTQMKDNSTNTEAAKKIGAVIENRP